MVEVRWTVQLEGDDRRCPKGFGEVELELMVVHFSDMRLSEGHGGVVCGRREDVVSEAVDGHRARVAADEPYERAVA